MSDLSLGYIYHDYIDQEMMTQNIWLSVFFVSIFLSSTYMYILLKKVICTFKTLILIHKVYDIISDYNECEYDGTHPSLDHYHYTDHNTSHSGKYTLLQRCRDIWNVLCLANVACER